MSSDLIRFGAFELDRSEGQLTRSGRRVHLPPQAMHLLELLVSRAGQVVSRAEIRDALWGGNTFVDFDASVNACMSQIRTALGDSPATPRFVETVPRKGYRFVAPLGQQAHAVDVASTPRRLKIAGVAAGLTMALAIVVWYAVRAREPVRVAVLPIEAPGASPELASLATLLEEAALVEVHRVASASLAVLARPAVAPLRGERRTMEDLREARIDFFVDATLQRVGNGRVRLHAKVARSRDQRILWARDYEFPPEIFVEQRLPLAQELAQRLAEAPRGVRATEQSRSTLVSDAILSAATRLGEGPAGVTQAIALLDDACAQEPGNSGARGLLAFAHAKAAMTAQPDRAASWERARAEAHRTLARQPENPDASAAIGAVLLFADDDRTAAGRHLQRAAAHPDARVEAKVWLSRWYSLTGAHDSAVIEARAAETAEPVGFTSAPLARALFEAGRFADASAAARRVLAIHPESADALRWWRASETALR